MYIHLKFNTELIFNHYFNEKFDLSNNHFELDYEYPGSFRIAKNHPGHDLNNPVPATLFANALRVLCGYIPIPTMRKTYMKLDRHEEIDDIAVNHSYIKYNTPDLVIDEYGKPNYFELHSTQKVKYDSHLMCSEIFKLYNGSTIEIEGQYNWNYVKRYFDQCPGMFKELLRLLEKHIGRDPMYYSFKDMIYELSKYWDSDEYRNDADNYIKEWNNNKPPKNKDGVSIGWRKLLFHTEKFNKSEIKITNSNTTYNSVTPLLIKNGIGGKVYVSGDFICEINNPVILERIKRFSGIASLMENGMVYIHRMCNYEPVIGFKETYKKIH